MRLAQSLSFRGRMVLVILLAATVPMLLSMEIIQRVASANLFEQARATLAAQRDLHKQKVEESFASTRDFVASLSEDLMVVTALRSFAAEADRLVEDLPPTGAELADMRAALETFYASEARESDAVKPAVPQDTFGLLAQYHVLVKNPKPSDRRFEQVDFPALGTYGAMHAQYHESLFKHAVVRHHHEDLLLVDTKGRVVYTARKGLDFATNLKSGPFRDTGLGRVGIQALEATQREAVFVADYASPPTDKAVSLWLAAPVIDGFGRKLGAVVLRLDESHFTRVLELGMRHRKSGEIYVFGADRKLRSQSHIDPTGTVLAPLEPNEAIAGVLAGRSGVVNIYDRHGAEQHVAYAPLDLPGLTWGLVTSESHNEAMVMIGRLRVIGWIMSALTVALGVILAMLQARGIKRQLGGEPGCLVEMAKKMANGDFAFAKGQTAAARESAVGALASMKARLSKIISDIRGAAYNVESGAREIANGNLNLSQRTEAQASHLQQTSSSMARMTESVQQNAQSAQKANELASAAQHTAERGVEVVSNAVLAMNAINEASGKISDITTVIDEIAFQTNLLALNAAVEAAHAGEQGRGFAVVASEVRGLAQRSAAAAREIKQLIEDSAGKVQTGTRLVDESGRTLLAIVESVRRVSEMISGIAATSQEQLSGIQQVNRSVQDMDEMTQQNAALVEQVAAASAAMGVEARKLNELIAYFNLGQGTDRRPGAARPRPVAAGVDRPSVPPAKQPASAAYTGAERRSPNRPWSGRSEQPSARVAQPGGDSKPAAGRSVKQVASDGDQWTEF